MLLIESARLLGTMPVNEAPLPEGVIMTTESVVPDVHHVWAVYLRTSEEARRRGASCKRSPPHDARGKEGA